MPTSQQNQLLAALFSGPGSGALIGQPGMPDAVGAPGYPESPLSSPGFGEVGAMQPGGPDRIPIFQHGRAPVGGSFFGVQENAPSSYAATPGFGNDGRMSPALQPRNPALDSAALLGMKGKDFNAADPFQRAALQQLFTTQEQSLGTLQNYGAGAAGETEKAFATQQNRILGQLAQRGMVGSNAYTAGASAVEKDRQQALNNLSDQLLGRKLDILSAFGTGIAEVAAAIGGQNASAKAQSKAVQQQLDAKGIGLSGAAQQSAAHGVAPGLSMYASNQGLQRKYRLGGGGL